MRTVCVHVIFLTMKPALKKNHQEDAVKRLRTENKSQQSIEIQNGAVTAPVLIHQAAYALYVSRSPGSIVGFYPCSHSQIPVYVRKVDQFVKHGLLFFFLLFFLFCFFHSL